MNKIYFGFLDQNKTLLVIIIVAVDKVRQSDRNCLDET
jgi:hypothetical protein